MASTAVSEANRPSGGERTGVAAPGRTVPFRGQTLTIHEVGEGPTIGYLHGMVGNPGVHPFLEALAGTGHKVVAPNLPGFTGSPACEDTRTLFDWVVATSEALDLAGLAGGSMVAASTGAMLALEVAAVRPEAFSHLVLVAPFGLYDDADPVADPFATTLGQQRKLLTSDAEVTGPFFDDVADRSAAELIEDGVARYLTRTAAASLVWPIPEFGLDTRIHRVSCPVTLIWGAEDRLIPPSYAARFKALLANVAGVHMVDGAGHLAEWDKPAEVAALVAAALG